MKKEQNLEEPQKQALNIPVVSSCFTKSGRRRRCKLMYFTTAGVLCNGKYLFCHVANFKECDCFVLDK